MLSFKKVFLVGRCFDRDKSSKYQSMLRRANARIKGELDLEKFLRKQNFLLMSILALMQGRQRAFVHKLSQPVLNDSSATTQKPSSCNSEGSP